MIVKIEFEDVKNHEEKVIAVKIFYYIDNAIRHPEWLLSEEDKSFDYEAEWDSLRYLEK